MEKLNVGRIVPGVITAALLAVLALAVLSNALSF